MLSDLIREIEILKKTAALVNRDLRKLPKEKVDLIMAAADEVVTGKLHEQFPLRNCQTGNATQTNMCANELISNRAIEMAGGKKSRKKPIRPNDNVNISQSYNDTFPIAMYVAAAIVLTENLAPALKELHAVLETKSQDLAYLAKIERTQAPDAPFTADQEISGSSSVERELERIRLAIDGFYSLAKGGKGSESASGLPAGCSTQWQNVEVVRLISNLLRLARRFTSRLFARMVVNSRRIRDF
jgi:fumarate hydratase, class II